MLHTTFLHSSHYGTLGQLTGPPALSSSPAGVESQDGADEGSTRAHQDGRVGCNHAAAYHRNQGDAAVRCRVRERRIVHRRKTRSVVVTFGIHCVRRKNDRQRDRQTDKTDEADRQRRYLKGQSINGTRQTDRGDTKRVRLSREEHKTACKLTTAAN